MPACDNKFGVQLNLANFVVAISLCVLSTFVLVADLRAQDNVVRVQADLTIVSLSVNDRDGRYITGLDKDDFKVFENGTEQHVEFCERVDTPFTVLFLFDTSRSMRDYLPAVANAANSFTSQLRPEDIIVAANFEDDAKIHMLLEPTKRKEFTEFVDVVESGKERSYTTTFDAVEKGLAYLKAIEGKKALIFFSDGELYGRHASAKSNLRDAEEQEAVIYTLQFGEYSEYDPAFSTVVIDPFGGGNYHERLPGGISKKAIAKLKKRVSLYLTGLAERTGGRAYKIATVQGLGETFRSIAEELGTTYRLGYSPIDVPKDGERRTISVKVNVPNAAIRSRKEVVYRRAD